MNWFELMPYNGGVSIEAEDFDSTVGFGTQGTTDIGGGGNLKDASTGDTATYLNVNIPVSGTYEATFRIASLNQPVRFALKNGSTTLVTVDQPATGGYQVWTSWATSSSEHIYLPAGTTTLTIESNGTGWNLNWFDLKLVAFE
jgi:endoglucanase